ncbi:MAG: hypothetical protein Q8K70_01145 [Bacteroidota bacterium]|nr:hypothetical protein [Bacteroidota bacterium]
MQKKLMGWVFNMFLCSFALWIYFIMNEVFFCFSPQYLNLHNMFVLKDENGGVGCIVGWLLPLGDWCHSNHGKKELILLLKKQ